MDNQQVTPTELAWLAGIWDGEGHVSIRRTILVKSGKPQYSPRVGVTNSNPQILTTIRQLLDRMGIAYYFKEKGKGGFEGSKKQTWVISLDTLTNAYRLLTHIRPYLIGKTFQADCLVEFCQRRITRFNRKHRNETRCYADREYELLYAITDANGNIRGTSETIREDAQRAMI